MGGVDTHPHLRRPGLNLACSLFYKFYLLTYLPRPTLGYRGICCRWASVRLSLTRRYCIETTGRIELDFGMEALLHTAVSFYYTTLLPVIAVFLQLEMHVRLICAIKFYLLTFFLTACAMLARCSLCRRRDLDASLMYNNWYYVVIDDFRLFVFVSPNHAQLFTEHHVNNHCEFACLSCYYSLSTYRRFLPCVPKKVSPLTFCNNNRKSAPI